MCNHKLNQYPHDSRIHEQCHLITCFINLHLTQPSPQGEGNQNSNPTHLPPPRKISVHYSLSCISGFSSQFTTYPSRLTKKPGLIINRAFDYFILEWLNYIIPPIPPMPAIADISGAAFSSGTSTTAASVVNNIEATDAAFSNAERVTFAGSTIPASNISTYL